MAPKKPAKHELQTRLRTIYEERIPFNRVLGLKVLSLDSQAPKVRFEMRPELIGNFARGILHGGVISAVLDLVGGIAIHLAVVERHEGRKTDFPSIGTVDLRVDYLRPGRGKFFVATGRVVRLGNRIAVTHMELANDSGELIATGSAAYVVG